MLNKLKFILTKSEKNKLGILFSSALLLALLETFSIGIIIPIMDLFVNQEKIQTSRVIQWFYRLVGAKDNISFLTVLIVTAIVLFVFKSLYTIFILYNQRKVVTNINVRLTTEVLRSYLHRPYAFHLESNSAILFRNVATSVSQFANYFLLSLVLIGAEAVILLGIFCLLIYLYPLVTLILAGALTIVMAVMNHILKKRINSYSSQRMEGSGQLHKFGLEALQAVKEIKVYNVPDFFTKRYSQAWRDFVGSQVKFEVVSGLPRHILDIILWTSILMTLLLNIHFHRAPAELIPMMMAFGLAALRVLPCIHKIYTQVNTVKYYSNTLDVVYKILQEDRPKGSLGRSIVRDVGISEDSQVIRLEKIGFRYRTAALPIFNELSLTIPRHKTVAFAGETGAGKSTLVDILMGLLFPVNGALYYGQEMITPENVLAYRRKISYVPQHIFLLDDTLEANIAFGISQGEIDYEQLKGVIQIARLEPLINDLPAGIKTVVGEKGIRLSGGQRQRVAIARALYRNPEILIMDEATSALDGYTEAELNKAIKNLYVELTIILIAHRLTTIENADLIYVMEQGKIVARGSYQELLENSTEFQKIANQVVSLEKEEL